MEIFTDPSGRFWGKVGAGGLFFAESTGRYLVAKRSAHVNEPNTWGTWGGAVEDGESPEEAVKREIGEEAGYYGDYTLKPVSVFNNGDYKYHNFLIVIPDEFTPEHSWETSGHEWVEYGDWPEPMHFGMREMVKHISESNHLDEDMEDWDTDVWLHYSDFPGVKINPQQFHQDPAGIYLFPEGFETTGGWWKKKYKFRVQLKRSLKILDLAKLSKESAIELMKKLVPEKYHETYEQEIQTARRPVDTFWELLKNYFVLIVDAPGKAAWNKALRNAGYDAVFDDTDSIHSAEVQLLVLDPRDIKIVERVDQGGTGFKELQAAFDHLVKKVTPYGQVQVTGPKKAKDWYSGKNELSAYVRVEKDGKYLSWTLRPYFERDAKVPSEISISVSSSQNLGGSKDENTPIDMRKGKFNPADMDVRLGMQLDAVFGPMGENWDSMFGDVALMLEAVPKAQADFLRDKNNKFLSANPEYKKLNDRLLALGGEFVALQHDDDFQSLVSRGMVVNLPVKMIKGAVSHCHSNVASLWWDKRAKGFKIWTGWVLDDAIWRQHTWGVLNGKIIESTMKRDNYFGIELSDEESKAFFHANRE